MVNLYSFPDYFGKCANKNQGREMTPGNSLNGLFRMERNLNGFAIILKKSLKETRVSREARLLLDNTPSVAPSDWHPSTHHQFHSSYSSLSLLILAFFSKNE